MQTDNRPLSPHLQIYRWQWTMALSILHRATGIALSVGTLMIACWLLAIAGGAEEFAAVQDFLGSFIGRLMLFGWTWSLLYHFCNGIRHLVWDAGYGFELETARLSGYVAAGASLVLTFVVWIAGYASM